MLSRRQVCAALLSGVIGASGARAFGQEPTADAPGAVPDTVLQLGGWTEQLWQFGVEVASGTAMCEGVHATFPIPREWPEQQIQITSRNFSPYITGTEARDLEDLSRQVVLRMQRIPPSATAQAIVTVLVKKAEIGPPSTLEGWQIPARPDKSLKPFLGTSPYIDPKHGKIRRIAAELQADGTEDGWKFVERVYDWVREHVDYREGDIKTAIKAIEDGNGDCEELTSAFVAICRASGMPTRMVWVPGHCYPEFYLENAEKQGQWFPCQVAGTRQFGQMQEARPILQKGDRFKVPEHRDIQRYVAEFCKTDALRGTGKPRVSFISEKVQQPELAGAAVAAP